ncbi:MAG: DNA mismatch endonuclease Vsr [Pseudomonadota bacterium]
MDKLTPTRRSALMARVRGKDTKPEMAVRRAAHAMGLRFRLHRRHLPGRPDLVLPKHGLIIFVHGCFWHRHADCPKASMPKSRQEFWHGKFERNQMRDRENEQRLLDGGWRVETIWECETKDEERLKRQIFECVWGSMESCT